MRTGGADDTGEGAGALAVGGGTGAPAGGLLSRPQWKMRVGSARPDSPGAEPTIVITSPVSTALTWKADVPFGSRQVFSNWQR